MTNDYLVSLPFARLREWKVECHGILRSITALAGEVRIEASKPDAESTPIHLRVFDDACNALDLGGHGIVEALWKADNRIAELTGDEPSTVDFYFSDPDSAVLFKLANGGAA